MPGILVIKQNQEVFQRNRHIIQEMAKMITHEPYYRSLFVEIPELGLHAGKVYFDFEYETGTISKNEDESIQCLLSGELYNTAEISASLSKNKHSFRDDKDTAERITHLYEEKEEQVFNHLNGHFNILLIDLKKKKIIVANDRFSLQRFYYCILSDENMVFAPEVKCFKCIPELALHLDDKAAIYNFRHNCLLENRSFYEEVRKFPIATAFTFANKHWTKKEYWAPEDMLQKPRLTVESYIAESTDVFESIVENYYTHQQTGFSLTGGYDTRSILSVLDRKKVNLPCYTFGGMYKDSLDVRFAQQLADLTGNTFHKLLLGERFLRDIDRWFQKAVYVSDGIAKLTFCHEYYMNLQAKELAPVRLTGKYGSQVVRGVTMLKDRSPDLRIFSDEFRQQYESEKSNAINSGFATLLREELPQLEATKQSQEDAVLTVRTPFMDNNFIDLILQSPALPDPSMLQENIINKNAPHFKKVPTNHFAHIPTNIGKFIKSGPIRNTKKLLYSSLSLFDSVYNWENLPSKYLPFFKASDFLRISRIFNGDEVWVHYRLWFMKELKEYISNILLDRVTLQRPWYNGSFIKDMTEQHFRGKKNFTSEINKIVSFEMWCRQNDI